MKIIIIVVVLATIASSNLVKPKFLSDEFINFINQKQSTWTAGKNFPENTTIEELKRLNGAKKGPMNKTKIKTRLLVTETIPENFDAREKWPECKSMKEIRNQGSCGSCWAFASVEAMSDRFCIASKGKYFQFSPEELVSCCSSCGYGCNGGYAVMAWDYWQKSGIVSGGDYNSNQGCQPYPDEAFYSGKTPQCEKECTNSGYLTSFSQDKHFGVNHYQYQKNVEAVQAEILKNGPVQAHLDVYEDFYNYRSGVYQHITGNLVGGHAVKIIGWGVENGSPYWLVANSWGESWGGLGGFFKILRGNNHCGIESEINAGDPKI